MSAGSASRWQALEAWLGDVDDLLVASREGCTAAERLLSGSGFQQVLVTNRAETVALVRARQVAREQRPASPVRRAPTPH